MTISYDINSEKWLSIWKLNKLANPDYYETMRKYYENLCKSLGREDLIQELNNLIQEKIEKPLGNKWQNILITHKNLPSLNSITKSHNPEYPEEYIYKYQLNEWLESIEKHIFNQLVQLEKNIRFKDRQTIM